ncbi:class I SAM-dependent methyltransferase [Dictyobacter arantiisoli]|nr:class I SAM-dependent methyltransferase [Dictyobacter arantiisoli]
MTKYLEVNLLISDKLWWQTLMTVLNRLATIPIDTTLIGSTSLFVQGVTTTIPDTLEISLQWDLMARACALFEAHEGIQQRAGCYEYCVFTLNGIAVHLYGYLNTVVVTDPDRLAYQHAGQPFWVKALDFYLRTLPAGDVDLQAIRAYLRRLQQENSQLNQAAWNQDAYEAWIHRHGTPQSLGERLRKDPRQRLSMLSQYLVPLAGCKVINLLGSHGAKAIAMSLLGADVTIVDISQENAHYAREVAAAAQTQIRYLVADVLALAPAELNASYQLVFMELGILHYFIDLAPLARIVQQLLSPGGRLILQDFHPISTKLITSKGKKHRVTGNYFDKTIIVKKVAFSKHLPGQEQKDAPVVYLRQWTLGEIVTAFAAAGLLIRRLDEEPNSKIDDIGLPKTFTLVAEKPTA